MDLMSVDLIQKQAPIGNLKHAKEIVIGALVVNPMNLNGLD